MFAFGSFAPTASAMRVPTGPPVAGPVTGTLIAYVYDSASSGEKPLAGAVLAFLNTYGDTVGKGISDANGSYVANLPEGSYKISVSLKGYYSGFAGATVKGGMDNRANIALTKSPVISDLVKVTIFVYDPRGDGIFPTPIPNALVQVFDFQGTLIGKGLTDERGNYAIVLKGGKFGIKVHADGYTDNGGLITLKGDETDMTVSIPLMP
jgi:hypothetical protein